MFTQRKFFSIIFTISLIKLWLISDIDLVGYCNAFHDDALFVQGAKTLYKFGWLGKHHTQLTLVKGPFYPMFLALNYWLGIPLLISEHILYLAACFLVIAVLRKIINNDYALIILFLLLAFNPVTYSTDLRRVIREGIYPALAILTFFSFVKVYITDPEKIEEKRKWIWLSGICLSCFWLTKEDGIWMVPSLVLIAAYAVWHFYFKQKKISLRILLFMAAPFLLLFLSINVVSLINKISYNIYETVDMKNKQFVRAYGALMRVKSSTEIPFIPVAKETRELLYKKIPSFAELKESEVTSFQGWAQHNPYCNTIPESCGETAGGWFVWALRDAVATQGYYKDGQKAQAYYKRLADDINQACDSGKLDCYPENNSMVPPLKKSHLQSFVTEFFNAWNYTIHMEGFSVRDGESWGDSTQQFRFEELTNTKLASESKRKQYDFNHSISKIKQVLLGGIGFFYQLILPFFFYVSLVCIAILMILGLKTRTLSVSAILCILIAAALVCRIAILALVHITSFPAITILYLSPVYPFLLIIIFLSIFEVYKRIRNSIFENSPE